MSGHTAETDEALASAGEISGLTAEQQGRVDRARAYAQELQETVFKEIAEAERRRIGQLPLGMVPGLAAGMDARDLSVMSRLYVGSVNFELTEELVARAFSEFGQVRSVSMAKDAGSGRHKGFGFVEYYVPEAAMLAMETMNGTMLGGRQLKIGRPNGYDAAVARGFPKPPRERIYVANVNGDVSQDALREIFAAFGNVTKCLLAKDRQGWGFIEYEQAQAAEQAAAAMNGLALANVLLRVRACVVGGPLGEPKSKVVVLYNVVERSQVDDELPSDMAEEGLKCGRITKVVVHLAEESDQDLQSQVCVFLLYAEEEAADKAVRLFDGRWFGGRKISASLFDMDRFLFLTSTDTMVFVP
ncbi:hypothetical protein LPJ78_003857 [Coemansia sp. RSA 989]|nr:hypothetical protein BX667DRAFT_504695 [Coemansia mojavensis]KAJ1748651.1 hypothetical protein LPJ79_004361 [Coemansia sp. RSA 1821]KAJ1863709.1 hypothetical protein LPJ78_003857 [Coemansia sp. RSA 989]KAJ1871520.1 hypothetical protein LPJ55_003819 [Coemansia sp. RSA 990]KAJ2668826.1 hypothetical protein IWW42_004962 [Coemansia sp. RSA 1085]